MARPLDLEILSASVLCLLLLPPRAPAGSEEEICAEIYSPGEKAAQGKEPLRLGPGPHLLIDDFPTAAKLVWIPPRSDRNR